MAVLVAARCFQLRVASGVSLGMGLGVDVDFLGEGEFTHAFSLLMAVEEVVMALDPCRISFRGEQCHSPPVVVVVVVVVVSLVGDDNILLIGDDDDDDAWVAVVISMIRERQIRTEALLILLMPLFSIQRRMYAIPAAFFA